MATCEEIYELICFDLCEPGGLQLGLIHDDDLLAMFNDVVMDFQRLTGLVKEVFTQQIELAIGEYAVTDEIIRVDEAYAAGSLLSRSTLASANDNIRDWRTKLDVPKVWIQDEAGAGIIRIIPAPDYNGTTIPGANEPDPPHGQYGDWSIVDEAMSNIGPGAHRGLTIIGLKKLPVITAWTDPIPLIPHDIAISYLGFGVLERIFRSDGEMRDDQRALYCKAQYEEGVSVMKEITGEREE